MLDVNVSWVYELEFNLYLFVKINSVIILLPNEKVSRENNALFNMANLIIMFTYRNIDWLPRSLF